VFGIDLQSRPPGAVNRYSQNFGPGAGEKLVERVATAGLQDTGIEAAPIHDVSVPPQSTEPCRVPLLAETHIHSENRAVDWQLHRRHHTNETRSEAGSMRLAIPEEQSVGAGIPTANENPVSEVGGASAHVPAPAIWHGASGIRRLSQGFGGTVSHQPKPEMVQAALSSKP